MLRKRKKGGRVREEGRGGMEEEEERKGMRQSEKGLSSPLQPVKQQVEGKNCKGRRGSKEERLIAVESEEMGVTC